MKNKRDTYIRWSKRFFLTLLVVAALSTLGFVLWAESPLPAAPEALSALESDEKISVEIFNDHITFSPKDSEPVTGFIFYPGGRVDHRAYAAPLRAIAEQGFLVVVLDLRLNLAFFDISAAEPIFPLYPQIQHWAVGGHSLGGVGASLYAKEHPDLSGIVFWASYPADDGLKNSTMDMLSIYGTRDMAGMDKFKETSLLLPATTEYVVLDGGNHAQFGDYGLQPGDKEATISRTEQQAQVVNATVNFLQKLNR